MKSLSGQAVMKRRPAPSAAPPPIPSDDLEWATVSDSRGKELQGVKTVSFDEDASALFATHKNGAVLKWDWRLGKFETFIPEDKDKNDMIHAVLCVGSVLWVSSGKGKIILYDTETRKVLTKVVGHTAEIFCMVKVSGAADARVITGSIDFVVKVWDEDAMLVSHSAHHHGAILCAIQWRSESDEDPPQIWTGSNDGSVFRWNDGDRNGKVDKEEGTTLRHSTSEAVTCLEQVDGYVWAGTERGKLVIFDPVEEDPVCEIPAHKERISSVRAMGRAAWSAGSDKVIFGWSSKTLPVRPKLLYKVDAEIGYVKNMVRISWAVWVFHSKGLAIYASKSTLEEANDRAGALTEEGHRLSERIKSLEDDVLHHMEVRDSLEHQLRTMSQRQEKAKADLAEAKERCGELEADLERATKDGEEAELRHGESLRGKEIEAEQAIQEAQQSEKERQEELAGLRAKAEEEAALALEREKAAEEERARLMGEAEKRASELEELRSELGAARSELDAERKAKDAEVSGLKGEMEAERKARDAEMEELRGRLEAQAESRKRDREAEVSRLKDEMEAERKAKDAEMEAERKARDAEMEAERKARDAEMEELRGRLEAQAESGRRDREAEVSRLKDEMGAEVEAERKAKDAEMEDMRRKLESALDAERRERQGEAEGLRGKIKEYEELMRSSEGENRELLRARDDEKRGLEEQLASAVRGREEAEAENSGLRDQVERSSKELEMLRGESKGLGERATALESELSTREEALASRVAEISDLQRQHEALQETSTRALDDALSKSREEMEGMKRAMQGEIEGLRQKLSEVSESRDDAARESEGRLQEARDGLSALEESLKQSEEGSSKLREENARLEEEVQNLRTNHAKTLLLAGSKHQELLARSRKEMEEKSQDYERQLEAKEAEIRDLQAKHSETQGEYEERMRELEQAQETKQHELEGSINKLEEDLEDARDECERQRQDAEQMQREHEELLSAKEKSHSDEVLQLESKINECEHLFHDQQEDLIQKQLEHERKLSEEREAFESKLSAERQEHEENLIAEREERARMQDEYENQLGTEREERAKVQEEFEKLQDTTHHLEEELGSIQAGFDQAEAKIREYQNMVNSLRDIHEEQTKIADGKHEEEKARLRHEIEDLREGAEQIKSQHEAAMRRQEDAFEEEKQTMARKHGAQTQELVAKMEEQGRAFDAKKRQILEHYKTEIENLTRSSKEVEQKLLLHIQTIEGVKRTLEADLSKTRDELQRQTHKGEVLGSKVESLLQRNEELEETEREHASEKERIFMELEDLRSLVESTRGANPLAYANMFHPDGVDVALYMRTLKQDIFNTISELGKEVGALKHEVDVRDKTIVSLEDQVKASEEALEKKRKKKRKWKMAYLRLSATNAEEVNGLQGQLQQTREELMNQQVMYKKVQQALRQAAHQLQHAKGLEGALDQAQGEYAQLLTKLSSVRQQAERDGRESRATISKLQAELDAKTRMFEQTMSEMNQEVSALAQIKRQQEQRQAAQEAARKLEEEARLARRRKAQQQQEEAPASPPFQERERYSGFVC